MWHSGEGLFPVSRFPGDSSPSGRCIIPREEPETLSNSPEPLRPVRIPARQLPNLPRLDSSSVVPRSDGLIDPSGARRWAGGGGRRGRGGPAAEARYQRRAAGRRHAGPPVGGQGRRAQPRRPLRGAARRAGSQQPGRATEWLRRPEARPGMTPA
jgi:hypothetical protein